MIELIFICGPNGVGKSTTCQLLQNELAQSAFVDSEWCRAMNPYKQEKEYFAVNKHNIISLLRNYLESGLFRYLIWTYGFHGPRKRIFDEVMASIQKYEFRFRPFVVTCSLEEDIARMRKDNRDEMRIAHAVEHTREIYRNVPYTIVDTTFMTAKEAACEIGRQLTRTEKVV